MYLALYAIFIILALETVERIEREKMRDLDTVTLWAEAVDFFEEWIMPGVRDQETRYNCHPDLPLRRESWNNYTDALCKDGMISDWQYDNWSQPAVCDGD